jgi:5-formyltetrahydrofolate cyclo-ligase
MEIVESMNFKDKKQIRQEILRLRSSLSDEEVADKSKEIFRKLLEMEIYLNSKIIMCYMDFRNEVATREFIKTSFLKGKRIILPLIDKDGKDKKNIIPCEIKDLDSDLEKGVLGILEPKKECKRLLNPEDIDLIVVPGIAFDILKNRIGYGAGYYDRFLKTTREDCLKVGVAFELQILDKINTQEHDVPLNAIITEKRVIL